MTRHRQTTVVEKYTHEAFLWSGIEAFLARTVPFLAEAVDAGTPTLVAVTRDREAALRDALGHDARHIDFRDMHDLGHNPARIIPAWRDFVAEHRASGIALRGIGEPIWAGRRSTEITECQIHEAMLNLAIAADAPLWLVCPYDIDSLPQDVLDEARRSHPAVVEVAGAPGTSGSYRGAGHARALSAGDLPAPVGEVEELLVARGNLAAVRDLVVRHGERAGLGANMVGDLRLAVTEVAANSMDHGGGHGVLRAWQDAGALVFEVRDGGRIDNLLAGRSTPTTDQARGRGLWLVNQLCDLMQIRSTDAGTVVRVHTWL